MLPGDVGLLEAKLTTSLSVNEGYKESIAPDVKRKIPGDLSQTVHLCPKSSSLGFPRWF